MVDFKELNAKRVRDQAFRKTELGQLFYAFENATISYWRNDANEHISDKKLRDLDDAARTVRGKLVEKLWEIVNV